MVTKQTEGRTRVEESRKKPKRIKVSTQRQITIPKEFYDAVHLHDEAIIELRGNEIIIRTAPKETTDFSTDILKDLMARGLEGDELLAEFERTKNRVAQALHSLNQEVAQQPLIEGRLTEFIDSLPDDEEQN